MNPTIYFPIIFLLIIVLLEQRKSKEQLIQYWKLKHGKENHVMKEAAERFLDKECLVYFLSGEVRGILREVTEHSLLLETPTDRQVLNLDFVLRIREYPKNKRGKKKSVVLD